MTKNKLEHIKKSGFTTPKGYFNTLEDAVFDEMASEKFSKKDGFESPKGYFSTLEDNVFKKLKLEEDKKETGYKIPENYLETVEDKVFTTINDKPKVIDFKTILLKRLIPIAAAASLLLFIFINYNQTTDDVNLDQLASTEIEQWIDDDLITFDTHEITEVFNDIELESQPIFEEEDLEDYLNGTDIESLILEN
ncbi:hypothetical protein [Aureibaculum conchae]|uniref:hypothetical protein n=1 Tax=Aureibaculum sp. 2308TA14-22 TaxID=3108392 RepID=UPI003390CD51